MRQELELHTTFIGANFDDCLCVLNNEANGSLKARTYHVTLDNADVLVDEEKLTMINVIRDTLTCEAELEL